MATGVTSSASRMVFVVPLIRVTPSLALLTYTVPPNLTLHPGDFVRIPFRTKVIEGIVWSDDSSAPRPGTKAILERIEHSVLTAQQLVLAQWLHQETLTPLNVILRSMVPGDGGTSPPLHPGQAKGTVVECATGSARQEVIVKWAERIAAETDRTVIVVPHQGAVLQWAEALEALRPLHIVPSRTIAAQHHLRQALGETRLYITTHVGLLSPFPPVQRVIVDLADDEAYYAYDQAPRVDIRTLAAEFARINCTSLLVLTRWLSPAVAGAFGKHTPTTIGSRPDVTLIDRQNEPASERGHLPPSYLLEKLQGTRTLWLHSRTSEAGRYVCFDCGTPVLCPTCSKPLRVRSRSPLTLECLQDHLKLEAPSTCAVCRGTRLSTRGPGIQQVARTIADQVGAGPVATLERGSIQGDLSKALHVISTTAIGSYPTLTFAAAVLLQPDSYFSQSGYRATEQFFSTLALARAALTPEGTLYVVTYKPETPAYAFLNDPDAWTPQALQERELLHYPPAGTLVILQPRKRSTNPSQQPFAQTDVPVGVTVTQTQNAWLLRTVRIHQGMLLQWIQANLDPSWEATVNPPSLPVS